MGAPAWPSPRVRGDPPALVLVVEHELRVADLERLYLSREGFDVHVEHGGRAGLNAAQAVAASLIIVDVALHDLDGIDFRRALRLRGIETPVLFVADNADNEAERARLRELGLGPGDYLTKPFSPRQLITKARECLRDVAPGAPSASPAAPTYQVGDLTLDPEGRSVFAGGHKVALTATEFDLVAFLMRRPGRVYTRGQLLSAVWGPVTLASARTVDVHVAQLRAKLGKASPIRTVRGVGYAVDG